MTSPSALIHVRIDAFRRCDFGFIFDSYHPASNFRRQFPDRDEYIRYGWASLGKDFRIIDCRVIREEIDGNSARVIFWMEFELHGERQGFAELAWLEWAGEGWLYCCGQKLEGKYLPENIVTLTFGDFIKSDVRVVY